MRALRFSPYGHPMSKNDLDSFVSAVAAGALIPEPATMFNPWGDHDPLHDTGPDAPRIRADHLQRYLAARSQRGAARAIRWSGWIVLVQFAFFLLIGVGLAAFYQGRVFGRDDEVFATFIVEELPVGAVGLTLAAVFAAAMSSSLSALAAAGVRPEDVDLVVPHQPTVRILEETAARTGIPFSRFVTTMDRYANTAGASVGVTLDHAVRTGRLHDGDIVVFAAVGSGWTWGAAVFRWSTTSPRSVDGSSRSGEMSRARNPAVVLP